MAGEMSQDEVTRANFPLHFAVADQLSGSVHAFDQYQGPYIEVSGRGKFWVQAITEKCSHGDYHGTQDVALYNDKGKELFRSSIWNFVKDLKNYCWAAMGIKVSYLN